MTDAQALQVKLDSISKVNDARHNEIVSLVRDLGFQLATALANLSKMRDRVEVAEERVKAHETALAHVGARVLRLEDVRGRSR